MIREGPYSPLVSEREGKTGSCLGYEDDGTGRPNERNIQNYNNINTNCLNTIDYGIFSLLRDHTLYILYSHFFMGDLENYILRLTKIFKFLYN